jgi:hypothetical protein
MTARWKANMRDVGISKIIGTVMHKSLLSL